MHSSFGARSRASQIAVIVALLVLGGCARTDFEMKGVVGGFNSDMTKVFVAHEAIEGVMPEMAMPFAADTSEIAGLIVGDAISFTLHVRRQRSWITDVERIPRSAVNLEAATMTTGAPGTPGATVESLVPGTAFPRLRLVDQQTNVLELPGVHAAATLIDFIYTRCPLPDYCPLLSARFRTIQDRTDANVLLVSVTIDPDFDTPAVLAEYGERYGADYSRWRFVTANPTTLDSLYGVSGINVFEEGETLNHNIATILLDGAGVVARVWRDTDGTVDEVLEELRLIGALSSSRPTSGPADGH